MFRNKILSGRVNFGGPQVIVISKLVFLFFATEQLILVPLRVILPLRMHAVEGKLDNKN